MPSQIVHKRGDGTLYVTADVADKAVLKQLGNPEAVDDYGNLDLFVESWADEPTYVGALHVIEEFDLDDFPRGQSDLEVQYPSVAQLFDALEASLTNKIIRQLNAASEVVLEGGIYSTGWDQRSFGLRFSASAEELEAIQEAQQKKAEKEDMERSAGYSATEARDQVSCIRTALTHLRQVDFGRHTEDDLRHLADAYTVLERCGIGAKDVQLAMRHFRTDPEKAAAYIYGPSGRGTNLGAIVDLTNMADARQHGTSTGELRSAASDSVLVNGSGYLRPGVYVVEAKGKGKDSKPKKDKGKGGNKTTGPQRTPKDLNGVSKCRSVDFDPKRPPAEQEWCTYDSHGNLRGRHKSKDDAVKHKLFLINMYWMRGKGKYRKDRPTNKPIKNAPRGKK